MEKRLKEYLAEMEKQSMAWGTESGNGAEQLEMKSQLEMKPQLEDLLVQIQFFQHERLIHLIVTVTFALLMVLAVLGTLFVPQPALFGLVLLLLILLIPYVRHYYILENGVQKLYQYYDKMKSGIRN